MVIEGRQRPATIEFATSDSRDLVALRDWLRGQGNIETTLASLQASPGELGAGEVLIALASSSVLSAAIKTLPDFLRSRRSGVRIEASAGNQKVVVDVTNAEDAVVVLERLLDDQP